MDENCGKPAATGTGEKVRKPYEKPAIKEHESLASATSFYYVYYYYYYY